MRKLVLLLLLVACSQPQQAPAAPKEEGGPGRMRTVDTEPRVVLPDGYPVHVEVAADDETRANGLMYRDRLRPGTGMLFFFPADGEYPFWMKNTLIPLDMIWIDKNQRVVHVAENVPPCKTSDCPNYAPNAVARYVLELDAGMAKEHGIKAGDSVKIENSENVIVR
ncbi:MAG TPA: DUF192 domain-containing protein [Thermoanaerobaculia bacterium]|jgi:hypothetical protein